VCPTKITGCGVADFADHDTLREFGAESATHGDDLLKAIAGCSRRE
jgi:hypothetical protein